jgi:hypothetical protein
VLFKFLCVLVRECGAEHAVACQEKPLFRYLSGNEIRSDGIVWKKTLH